MQGRLRLKDRRRRLLWVKVAAGATVLALCLVAVFYVSRLPNFLITDVEVTGTSIIKAEEVKKLAEEKLSGSYAFIVPHNNAFLAPRSEIKNSILAVFPPAGDVEVVQKEPHVLRVTITERAAVAVWCESAEGVCYGMDAGGFLFTETEPTDAHIRYYGAIVKGGVGETFPDFASLHTFIEETAKTIRYAPETVTVDPNDDVAVTLSGGGVLKFVKAEDTRATLDNIASVFASQSFKEDREFEYADFRYGNKVYVKFKGD